MKERRAGVFAAPRYKDTTTTSATSRAVLLLLLLLLLQAKSVRDPQEAPGPDQLQTVDFSSRSIDSSAWIDLLSTAEHC